MVNEDPEMSTIGAALCDRQSTSCGRGNKDIVARRIASDRGYLLHGFSYQVLQANDFLESSTVATGARLDRQRDQWESGPDPWVRGVDTHVMTTPIISRGGRHEVPAPRVRGGAI